MKVSKLIKRLQKLQEKHGDLNVVLLHKWNSCLGHDYAPIGTVKIAKPNTNPQIYIDL